MTAPNPAEITVHEAIVEALATEDNPARDHGQLCPCSSDSRAKIWARAHKRAATIWDCNCWRLPKLLRLADAVCATFEPPS